MQTTLQDEITREMRGLTSADTQPLGIPAKAHQVAATATASASLTLSLDTRAVSICATGAAIRVAIGEGAQVATTTTGTTTSHYIPSGETRDYKVRGGWQLSVIRAGSTDAVAEVSELL